MRRLPKFNLPNVHFITTNVFRRHPMFNNGHYVDIIFQALHAYKVRHKAKIYGYVLMPVHLHMLLSLPEGGDISAFVRDFKKWTARNILDLVDADKKVKRFARPACGKKNHNFNFWQESFYDFNVYTRKKFLEKLAYMHNDPVRRGLAATPGGYPYSSYGYYACGDRGHLAPDRIA